MTQYAELSPAMLRILFRRLNIPIQVELQTSQSTEWQDSLSRILSTKGFRTKCWLTTLPTIAPQISHGLPAIAITPEGEWILLENQSWNWIQYYNLSRNLSAWTSIHSLDQKFQTSPTSWLLIEPIQPKAILSSDTTSLRPIQRLWKLIGIEKFDIGMIVALGILIGICALAVPLTIQVLINWVAFGSFTQPIVSMTIVLFVVLCLTAGLSIFQRIIVERFERRLFIRTVEDLSRRFHQVHIEALDQQNVSDLANRFFDILTIQKSTSTLLIEGFGSVLQLFVAILILTLYHPWFIPINGILLTGMVSIFWFHANKGTVTAIKESKSKYKVASWIEEIGNHSSIFRVGNYQVAPFTSENLTALWLEHREKHFSIFIKQYGHAQLFQILMSILFLLFGAQLVLSGELTIGQFVAAEFVVTTALIGFTKFIDKMDTIYDLLASIDKIGTVLDLTVESPAGISTRNREPIAITLEHVKTKHSFTELNGSLAANTLHLIQVPFNSSPKHLAEVLCGIRKPIQGIVRHNQVDIRHYGIAERYQGIHLLSDAQKFDGSILDNITMGDSQITQESIWSMLSMVGISESFASSSDPLDEYMPMENPLVVKGILLTRCLLSRCKLCVLYRFFEGVPQEWRQKWLELLTIQEMTIIVLESTEVHLWSELPRLRVGFVGDLNEFNRN